MASLVPIANSLLPSPPRSSPSILGVFLKAAEVTPFFPIPSLFPEGSEQTNKPQFVWFVLILSLTSQSLHSYYQVGQVEDPYHPSPPHHHHHVGESICY